MAEGFGTFVIDHEKMDCGIYIARTDHGTITFDIRTRKPYVDECIGDVTMHSVEHVMATQLEEICPEKIYWGPMGCRTGHYFIVDNPGKYGPDLAEYIGDILMTAVSNFDGVIPFNSREQCGNCRTLAVDETEVQRVEDELETISALAYRIKMNKAFDEYPYL